MKKKKKASRPQHEDISKNNDADGLLGLMASLLNGTQENMSALLESLYAYQDAGKIILDGPKPLSKSLLWQMQERYYSSQSVSAWNHTVPFLVTNSTFIAEAYGDLLVAYLRDALPTLNPDAPVYIVEMSAGTGRFGFYLLRELQRKLDLWPTLADLDIRYVMTDITGETIDFWQGHERLKPFVDKGILDFALFRPEQEKSLTLVNAEKTLSAEDFQNPMLVIANYLFDTVRHDIFRAENGVLSEGRVSLALTPEAIATSGFLQSCDIADIKIDDVETHVDYKPLPSTNYYPGESGRERNDILAAYCKSDNAFNFILPVGAFDCIANLEAISGGNFAIFTSDKGYTSVQEMSLRTEHGFAAHGGFSYPVNFDAINRYFRNRGASVFCSDGHAVKLHTACYIHTPQAREGFFAEEVSSRPKNFRNLGYVFEEKINRNKPASALLDVLVLTSTNHEQLRKEPSLRRFLGIFQATYYEPTTFCNAGKAMLEILPKATPPEICELLEVINRVWENDYFFKGECNLPFWISQVLYSLGFYTKSLWFLDEAERRFGAHEALYYLKGNCHEKLSQPVKAKENYEEALLLKPEFPDARKRLEAIAT
ncbi:MAG: hypothetical protein VKJ04_11915 [Vampirovibrionales bacterium]|nr:hypothetical protein [Vampirovibrionales bacterium]